MAVRKDRTSGSKTRSSHKDHRPDGFYTPFLGLDQHLPRLTKDQGAPPPSEGASPPQPDCPEDPALLFRSAMVDVKPLCSSKPQQVPPPSSTKSAPRFLAQEDAEVRRHLVELVRGEAPFDLWCSDEYVDGAVVGLSPELIKNLKRGLFSYQDYVDLHGCTCQEAHDTVIRFLKRSFAQRYRCVLIVSGRGLNSREREPVLKQELVRWLTHAPLRRLVLAFASARSYDGGAGAIYVLLRRKEGKAPFVLPAR